MLAISITVTVVQVYPTLLFPNILTLSKSTFKLGKFSSLSLIDILAQIEDDHGDTTDEMHRLPAFDIHSILLASQQPAYNISLSA